MCVCVCVCVRVCVGVCDGNNTASYDRTYSLSRLINSALSALSSLFLAFDLYVCLSEQKTKIPVSY